MTSKQETLATLDAMLLSWVDDLARYSNDVTPWQGFELGRCAGSVEQCRLQLKRESQ